jgi:hypothetical protein
MPKICKIEPLVYDALISDPETRGDNFKLYIAVLEHFINPEMSIKYVFANHVILGIPSLESITRVRRKLQEKNHELRSAAAEKVRKDEEQAFIEYSRE